MFCYNCSLALQHPNLGGIGTKHLITHLKTKSCRNVLTPIHNEADLSASTLSQRQQRNSTSSIPAYTTTTFEKELVRVVIDSNWSFRTVERPSFHRFLRFLRPDTVIISRCKFKTIFKSQHEEAKRSILRDLGKSTKISIALDAWSAANHLCFLAVKGYYINKDWKLQEKLLDFLPMRGRHTGTSMADEVLHILLDTKTKTQLLAITCDNASNNSVLARTLQSKLQEVDIQWSARENTIPCLAHIINLVVQDIIQHLRLAATTELGARDTLQRRHIQDIETHISVPNSLRKVFRF